MEYLLVWVLGVICGIVLMLNVVSRRLGCVQSTVENIRCMLLKISGETVSQEQLQAFAAQAKSIAERQTAQADSLTDLGKDTQK